MENFQRFDIGSVRGGTRHPGFIVCHVQLPSLFPRRHPLLFCDFRKDSRWCREIKLVVHRWSGLHRRILETVPLLGITEREKMVLEPVSGTASPFSPYPSLSHLWSIDNPSPLLPSISIFPLRKSIIETWEISKLYISFVSPWRAVRFISKQLRTLQEGWNYYWNEFILFEFGESKCKCKCIRNFVRFALRGFVYYMNTRDVVDDENWFLRIFPFLGFIGRELTGASFSIESPELFSVLVSLNPRWQVDYDTTRRGYAFESNWGYCCRLFTPGWMHIHPAQAL